MSCTLKSSSDIPRQPTLCYVTHLLNLQMFLVDNLVHIGCMAWNWILELGFWNWILELGFWNWILESDSGIGFWNWILELDSGIGFWNWILEFGILHHNWNLELEF
jgi:hypothetical protein